MNVFAVLARLLLGVLALGGGALLVWNQAPRGAVEGRILGPQLGGPIENARLTLIDAEGTWHRARTDKNGEWSLELPTGAYKMRAQSGRWQWSGEVQIAEAQTVSPPIALKWVPPDVPQTQPLRDPRAVERRVREIVGARAFLTRETLLTIAANNQSNFPLSIIVAQAGAESSFRPDLEGDLDEIGLFQPAPRDRAGRRQTSRHARRTARPGAFDAAGDAPLARTQALLRPRPPRSGRLQSGHRPHPTRRTHAHRADLCRRDSTSRRRSQTQRTGAQVGARTQRQVGR